MASMGGLREVERAGDASYGLEHGRPVPRLRGGCTARVRRLVRARSAVRSGYSPHSAGDREAESRAPTWPTPSAVERTRRVREEKDLVARENTRVDRGGRSDP